MKTTIVDVAKACNVSVATVSRVINGNYPVKEETKEKVLKVISGEENILKLVKSIDLDINKKVDSL